MKNSDLLFKDFTCHEKKHGMLGHKDTNSNNFSGDNSTSQIPQPSEG